MNNSNHARLIGALLLAGAGTGGAHPHDETMAEMTVIANRLETPTENVGSAFSALEVEFLRRGGTVTLEDALRLIPGTGAGSEGGQRGSLSALRMRGSEADHTLVLIDGMRVTDANMSSFNLLGGETILGFSSIEVVRGPQSALYGSEAIGGVVSLETKQGSADGKQRLAGEAGSFGTVRSGAEFQGELRGFRWYLGGSYEMTANDRSVNDFEQWQQALRVEQDLGGATIVGVTARTWMSEFESPGDGTPFAFEARDERDAYLVTAYVEHALSASVRTKAVLGYYHEEFQESSDFPFDTTGRKVSLDLRNEIRWDDEHQTVVGGLLEWTAFQATSTPVDEDAWQTGVYANHMWSPGEDLTLTLGGRWEHFDRWDDVFTWRATASWETPLEGVRLHGSYGTGFRAPSFFELFGKVTIPGFPPFVGNPNLVEEHSRGWDVGIAWQPCDAFLVDVTWFHNRMEDLIDFTPVNVGDASTRGIEVEARGTFFGDHLEWRGAYTWLEANDDTTDLRLARRARHVGSFEVRGEPTEASLLGVGGTYVSGVVDNDFSAFPASRETLDAYLLVRVFGRYEITENIAVHGRVENLLDEDFEEIANFPGRGLGAFGGVEVSW